MYLYTASRTWGIQRRVRWKRLWPPSLRRRGRRGGRASLSFSSTWGWDSVCTGETWNLTWEGITRRAFFGWSVQPKGAVHWHWSVVISVHECLRISRDTLAVDLVRTTTTTTTTGSNRFVSPLLRDQLDKSSGRPWLLAKEVQAASAALVVAPRVSS